MRIRDIQSTTLRFAYPPGEGFHYAGGCCTARVSTLVRIFTDTPPVGLGSVYSHPDLVRTIIEDQLRPLLVGEDVSAVETLWERCYSVTRWYGRKGAAVSALGGIDMALWDLRGKAAGLPVYQLLGACRHTVPVYASALLWKSDAAELCQEARRHLARGFRARKTRYPLAQARRLAPAFCEANIFWLEEPFLPETPELFAELRPHLAGIPLAAGENEFGRQGFAELIDGRVVDIVQPDACRCGGITESLRVVQLAGAQGLRVALHTWSDAVALTANMHVLAAAGPGVTVEMDQTGNPLIEQLLTAPWQLRDGELALPQLPGLGITLDEETVGRYSLPPGASIPEGNYSDMVFGPQFYSPAPPYEA